MGIFNFFGSKKTPPAEKKQIRGAFSTPFLEIGRGDLSTPYIDSLSSIKGYARFGADNLYPQLLNQLYHRSPLHGAIIDFIDLAVRGNGHEWVIPANNGKTRVEEISWERRNKLNHLIRCISMDILIHNRVTCKICYNDGNPYIERFDPETIRNNKDLSYFCYSYDWSRGRVENTEYPAWRPGIREDSIWNWHGHSPGQSIYPLPVYNKVLNWLSLDADFAFFHKNNIKNSVFPSAVLSTPFQFNSDEEEDAYIQGIRGAQGPEYAGRIMLLQGTGFDNVPTVEFPTPNANDKSFLETSKEMKKQICFPWKINPAIMGIEKESGLGNAQELQMAYSIFEKVIVLPTRANLEEVLGELISTTGYQNEIVFNNLQIVEKQIIETPKL
jgi:hypothetical protein